MRQFFGGSDSIMIFDAKPIDYKHFYETSGLEASKGIRFGDVWNNEPKRLGNYHVLTVGFSLSPRNYESMKFCTTWHFSVHIPLKLNGSLPDIQDS